MVAGRGMRCAVAPLGAGRGALTAWTPERQLHHDAGAYEAPLVLNLPAILEMLVDRHGFAPCSPACEASDLLNDRAAQENW